MKLTIIYDNTSSRTDLQADWGFASLVEAHGHTILFDTGANGDILLSNMHKLHIDPQRIDEVFISHAHYDHTGGLEAFLKKNNQVRIYVPEPIIEAQGAREVIEVPNPHQLHKNIYSTGMLDNIEQSMAVSTSKGLLLVAGCSHPDMAHILNAAAEFGSVYGIIGGLHGFNQYELFSNMGLICATHCTQHKREIRERYAKQYMEGGAGTIIEID